MLVKNLRDGPNYSVGLVVSKLGKVNFEVEVNGEAWKRHADQLMIYKRASRPDLDIGLASHPETSTPSCVLPFPGASVVPELVKPMEMAAVAEITSDLTESLDSILVVVPTNPLAQREAAILKVYPYRDYSQQNWCKPTF